MNIKKRIMSAALTAAMVASLPTAAYASGEKLELVVSDQTNNFTGVLGENKYFWDDENGDRLLISVTEDDIADFADSGEFSYSEIANLNELFDCGEGESVVYYTNRFFNNGYILLAKENNDGVTSKSYCAYYDGSELSIVDEIDGVGILSANKYIAKAETVDEDNDGNSDSLHISITAPDGEKSSDLTFDLGNGGWSYSLFPRAGENIYLLTADGEEENQKLTLYIISETGEVKENDLIDSTMGLAGCMEINDEFIIFRASVRAKLADYIYLVDENELIRLNFNGIKDSSSEIFNNKLIIQSSRYDADDVYALYDLEQNKIISEGYSFLYTNDGKIYPASKADGTWGYLDSNGNEIQFFEDAGDFIGDYAPIVKDGKAYLIDRNMNIVSNGTEADGVQTINENLYAVYNGDESYLMTFKLNNAAATDEPVVDEPVANEPVADEPVADEPVADTPVVDTDAAVDTGKDNPDTGAEGIAAIAAIGITAIGAALLSKKKK